MFSQTIEPFSRVNQISSTFFNIFTRKQKDYIDYTSEIKSNYPTFRDLSIRWIFSITSSINYILTYYRIKLLIYEIEIFPKVITVLQVGYRKNLPPGPFGCLFMHTKSQAQLLQLVLKITVTYDPLYGLEICFIFTGQTNFLSSCRGMHLHSWKGIFKSKKIQL